MTEYGLGRLPEFDERSRMFRAVGPLAAELPLRTKAWRRGGAYDQGPTPQCVAYTGKGILNTAPLSGLVPYTTRSRYSTNEFYAGAQENDEWPGSNYDGTSALGLGKYLLSRGLINSYRWCFGLTEVLQALSYEGPVGIGVWWHDAMFEVDGMGYIHPEGGLAGGHEVELIGIDVTRRKVIGMNSWGEGWGINGRFYLRWDDLGTLLANDGDAVVFK